MKRLVILSLIVTVIAGSCTKDIHLNLQNAAGLLVIEGNISNKPGPYQVLLSKTVTFYDTDVVVPVSGAKVIITDNVGNRDSLREGRPGTYETTSIIGTVGRTYHLSVNSGGKQYDAYCVMNPSVPVDSIGIITLSFFGRSQSRVFIQFHDPAGVTNYYKGFTLVNHSIQYKVNPINDDLNDGGEIQAFLRSDSSGFKLNDTISAELDAIDQNVYNYFNSLNSSTLSSQTAAPANPVTNISNNALGYFSAYGASVSHTIVIDANGYHQIY